MKRQRDYRGEYVHSTISRFPPEEVDPFINYTKKVTARFQYHQPKKFVGFIRIVEEALMVSEEKGGSLDDEEKEETVAATDSKTIGFREAMDFVKKLSMKCGEDVYEELLKNFRLYRKGSRNMADVCNFSLRLTEGHPDLQADFLKFMPITDAKSLAYRLPVLQSSSLPNRKVDKQQKRSPEIIKFAERKSWRQNLSRQMDLK